jgi:hypothetical protein
MLFFRRLLARIKAWKADRRLARHSCPPLLDFSVHAASIYREVTPHGVRVFNLCASCGAMLQASATLCDECAQKRSNPARPY